MLLVLIALFLGNPYGLCLLPQTAQGSLFFEHLDRTDGLPGDSIYDIHQDQRGFLWFATSMGLCLYDGRTIKVFPHDSEDPNSISDNSVNTIAEDNHGSLWVGTRKGLNRYNPLTHIFERFYHVEAGMGLRGNWVRKVVVDAKGDVWVLTNKGLNVLRHETGEIQVLDHSKDGPVNELNHALYHGQHSGYIWLVGNKGLDCFQPASGNWLHYAWDNYEDLETAGKLNRILEDETGKLWLGSNFGVYHFDPVSGQTRSFQHVQGSQTGLAAGSVRTMLLDSAGHLWVATGGLSQIIPQTGEIRRFVNDPTEEFNAILEDRGGVLWFGSMENGILKLDPEKSRFTQYRHQPGNQDSLSTDLVNDVLQHSSGEVYAGTDGGLNRFNPLTGKYIHYHHDPSSINSLSGESIAKIDEDDQGRLWLALKDRGVDRFDPESGNFAHFRVDGDGGSNSNVSTLVVSPKGHIWIGTTGRTLVRLDQMTGEITRFNRESNGFTGRGIWRIMEDPSGELWVGSYEGLNRMNPETQQFTHYENRTDDSRSLGHNTVNDICRDQEGNLWIATSGSLDQMVNERSSNPYFIHYTTKHGLPSNRIYSIAMDRDGHLWLGTINGLARFNPRTGNCSNFDVRNGLVGYSFFNGFAAKTGDMFFAGDKGVVMFQPEQFRTNMSVPPVLLTELRILNEPVQPGPGRLLDKHISVTKDITLTHRENVFSIDFAALLFNTPERNQYAYRMFGFENDWTYLDNSHTAPYMNLPPGDYTFRVKAANHDGVWNQDGASLGVTILPPMWLSWWAKSLYVLAILLAIALYLRSHQLKLDYERAVNERLQRVDKLKDEFLANTSHELRTPLNGIIGLAESLSDGATGPLSPQTRTNLGLIVSSGKRLAGLINDILDFSKLRNHNLDLNMRPVGLHAVCNVVLTLSQPLIGKKNLRLINEVPLDLPPARGDEDRLQQVLFNLVGNGIKFTHEGHVTVNARKVDGMLAVSVSDSGIGIPIENQEEIFESFEQGDGSVGREFGGTGLGLAVARQLIDLHDGTLSVESEPNKGSTFTFTLPISQEPLDETLDEQPVSSVHAPVVPENSSLTATLSGDDDLPADKFHVRFRILVVDDEPVNRQVLCNHLALRNYYVEEASGGKEALDILNKEDALPFDLVLMDVMMPGLSGYEVCEALRRRQPLKDLPVIFLTAKNQVTDLVTAFESGGNDFLTKPVSKEELLSRVRTHLQLLDINRNLEKKVEQRTQQLSERTEQLSARNKHILSSINYAQRIQVAILPEMTEIAESISDFFIFFRPKDIVSGDFFWFCRRGDANYIAVVDCTGHGVPGAFMSIIGNTLLNQIVKGDGIEETDAILNRLHEGVVRMLKQEREVVHATDGMDMGIIKMTEGSRQITFSGAGRPLYIAKAVDQQSATPLTVIRGDRLSIGGKRRKKPRQFTAHTFDLARGDILYLTTDGFADQPNADRKSYGSKRLREYLASIAHLGMQAQKHELIEELEDYQDAEAQRDDITVMGIRMN